MPHVVDRPDERSLHGVGGQVAHELAVDLEEVHRQALQIGEGGEAGAEVVEDEAAAELLERQDELARAPQVRDRRRLGDLEAETARLDVPAADALQHEIQECWVAQRLAR